MQFTYTFVAAATVVLFAQAIPSLISHPREAAIRQADLFEGSPVHLANRDNQVYNGSALTIEIYNGRDVDINAYIGGKDPTTMEQMMLRTDMNKYYFLKEVMVKDSTIPEPVPDSVPLAIPIGKGATVTVTLPDWLRSGRIWLAEGGLQFRVLSDGAFSEPSGVDSALPEYNVRWGFVELDNTAAGIIVNLSFVDWVSLSIGMSLTSEKGIESVQGLSAGALEKVCDDMKAQSSTKDAGGHPEWAKMCIYSGDGNTLLRVISPNIYASLNRANNSMADYYAAYVDQAWKKYTNQDLKINLQGGDDGKALATPGPGVQTLCRVSTAGNMSMTCDKAPGYQYPKPTTEDIWSCSSGPFVVGPVDAGNPDQMMHSRIVPRLCAAFARSTILRDDGDVQPYSDVLKYYQDPVTNHYSRIVHNYLDAEKGYAFAYDDVNPEGINHDTAGVLDALEPKKLHIDVKADST
jgi:hypothetical protein